MIASLGIILEGPTTVIVFPPAEFAQFNCTYTEGVPALWRVDTDLLLLSQIADGELPGLNSTLLNITNGSGNALLVTNIVLNDSRNGTQYVCVIPQGTDSLLSDPAILIVAGM